MVSGNPTSTTILRVEGLSTDPREWGVTVQLGQPSVSFNPLPTYSTHAVPPPTGGIHSIDFAESDDCIHMLSWDDQGSKSIVFDDGYGDDGVSS